MVLSISAWKWADRLLPGGVIILFQGLKRVFNNKLTENNVSILVISLLNLLLIIFHPSTYHQEKNETINMLLL